MKEKIKHNAFLIAVVMLVVALDRWTKILVTHKLQLHESISPIPLLGDFFKIVPVHNTGAAFGLLKNANVFLLVVSLIISIVILFYYQMVKTNNWVPKISVALIVGGAVGNIIDRIKFAYVIDFLSFGRFPVFNVADSAVTIGVFLMIIYYIIEERKALNLKKVEVKAETVPVHERDIEEDQQ